jgi:hypothetical protein
MLTFFIVTEKMLQANLAGTIVFGKFNYELTKDSFVGPAFFVDAGQALNYAKLKGIREPFSICRGYINPADAMLGLEAVLVGNRVASFRVAVDETTKISGI